MIKVKSLLNKVANFFYNIPRILFINFYKLFIRLNVFNIKNIPENGPAILAINHVTGADPIIILGAIKKQIYFLAESENFKSRFTNFFMRRFANSVPIFKKQFMKNIKSFKELFTISANKKKFFLGIFPEGDLNKKGKLKKFHKGAAYFSYKTKIPIIPIYIHNLRKGPSKKRWVGRNNVTEGIIALFINIFKKINIFVGDPINPMAENIIEDFKELKDKKTYREITQNINKTLEDEFLELEAAAEKLFGEDKMLDDIEEEDGYLINP